MEQRADVFAMQRLVFLVGKSPRRLSAVQSGPGDFVVDDIYGPS